MRARVRPYPFLLFPVPEIPMYAQGLEEDLSVRPP